MFQEHAVTTYGFVPFWKNATLVLEPEGATGWSFFEKNQSDYRITLDVNSTVLFRIYRQTSNVVSLSRPCNLSGQVTYEKLSAKFKEVVRLGPGYFGYVVCNIGSSTAYGQFRMEVFEPSTTTPYYNLGSFMQFLTLPAGIWAAFWMVERLVRRTKTASAVRIFGWLTIAPFFLLLITVAMMSGIYWEGRGEHVSPLALIEAAPGLIAIILQKSVHSQWPQFYSLTSIQGVSFGLLFYLVRLMLKLRTGAQDRSPLSLHSSAMPDRFGKLLRKLSTHVFPDTPDVAVFSRTALMSLLIVGALMSSPLSFVRELIPIFGSLVPDYLFEFVGLYDIIFFFFVIMLPVFAYSLKWKPTPLNTLFRLIAYGYVTLFVISCVVFVGTAMSDVSMVAVFVYLFMTLIPSVLLGGYVSWILEWAIRVKIVPLFSTRIR